MLRSIVALALVAAIPERAMADDRRTKIAAQVRDLLDKQRQLHHVPGLTYAVVLDDQIIALDALGERDIQNRLPATADTVFPIGSCTKSFTALAVGIAQDERLLTLDDSPRRWLPGFRMQDREANELVTLRDMLSHRTGLKAYADLATLGGVLTRDEYLRAAIGAKPAAKFRSTYQYSNAMITAAGETVARAYKLTWDGVIKMKVLTPLGMSSSVTSAYGVAKLKDGAIGYEWNGTTWKPAPVTDTLAVMAPAGAIASSARDMARYVRMLTAGGKLDGKQIVAEDTLRELTRAHTKISPVLSYALGWATYDWNGLRVVEHNGGSAGLSAIISFIPDRRAGFVILANVSPTEITKVGAIAQQMWPIILGPAKPGGGKPSAPPRTTPPTPPPAGTSEIPPLDELLARMIVAGGGVRTQQRHTAMRLRATSTYEHQGVHGQLVVLAKAPASRVEDETLEVGAKRIGRARSWFDGGKGAQQTTFGQDSTLAGDALESAKRDNLLHPLLDLRAAYKTVAIERVASLGGEDAFVLLLTPTAGKPVRLYVSARTGLVVRRETDAQTTTYGDFRNVDGEVVPFAITVENELGEQTIRIADMRFNSPIADTELAPIRELRR